jgi:cysteine-S-conjugate beta-lyase
MSQNQGLDRRAFLKNAGLTALVGAVAPGAPLAAVAAAASSPPNGKYDFDTIYNRFGTDSTKFDQQIGKYGKDSIQVGMGIADMDFKAAPPITKALHERMQHENWGYLDMTGPYVRSYAQGIIDWNKRRYGVTINPDNLVLTAGVHPGIIAALITFSPRGSKVLLQTPTYNGFYSDLTASGTRAEESPLKLVNGRYSMDFEDLERRINHETNTLILCNPQNPTGNCWSAEDLTRLGEICLRRRVIVLADEIHCDYVTKGNKYTPFSSLPNKDIVNNSITFKAASKSFGLAAMKHAWMFSDNASLMNRVRVHHRADLTTLGMVANKAAYTPEGEDWLNQCVAYIDANHDFVKSYVDANIPMIKVMKPEGTYLCWLDVTAVAEKIGAKRLAEEANRTKAAGAADVTPETMVERFFVKHAKVHLNQGASYGFGGANHMRMNIATSRKLVELALNNIAQALRNT